VPEGLFILSLDIGERRRVEDALRHGEEKYRLLAENMSDVSWILDLETSRLRYVSPSVTRSRGYTVEEVLSLAVSDDGKGMGSDTLAHLFEPFFTTKAPGKGTGLGLANVYGVVKQNGGFINVYSEQGQGATFRIYLPRHRVQAEPERAQETVPLLRGGSETVLLVEDERAILDLAVLILEDLGYTVLAARTPDEAIRIIASPGLSISC
jgi:two-component system, cell cycle sensor histidine kinase and response regulator CckA